MKNKKVISISIISILLILLILHTSMYAYTKINETNFGYKCGNLLTKFLNYNNSNDKKSLYLDKVIAYAGETPVYEKDLKTKSYEIELEKQIYPESNQSKSVWNKLLFEKRVKEYARINNIEITDEIFYTKVAEQREALDNTDLLKSMLKGMNLTADQYWEKTKDNYRYIFLQSEVYFHISNRLGVRLEEVSIRNKKVSDYLEKTIPIKIIDKSIINKYK
ncbi:hypothetical protein J2Z76_002549 [Sedimentibacter acidaminivorans]|jgi:hypothetical protein|uniref:Uncharacterized protein n=1 Tax=Sedimentibacter acidaminivorans TaxID=913099 RepID=A0ABS4GG57_9FIRM|nr:hypothetical protein [Sedimentibacter acidaminivorans]MBP1926680.1 hypothetical protein [Sedimentibacter acidaminivorans]